MPTPIQAPGAIAPVVSPANVPAPGVQGAQTTNPVLATATNVPTPAPAPAPTPATAPVSATATQIPAPAIASNAPAKAIASSVVPATIPVSTTPAPTPMPATAQATGTAAVSQPAPYGTKEGYEKFQQLVAKNMNGGVSYEIAKAQAASALGENARPYELAMNLERGQKLNAQAFASREAFDAAYNYASKSPEEKTLMDAYYNRAVEGKAPVSANAVVDSITNPGKAFQSEALTNQISNMQPSEIFGAVRSGIISEASPEFSAFTVQNPRAAKAYQNYKQEQNIMERLNSSAMSSFVALKEGKLDKNKSLASQVKPTETPVYNPATQNLREIQNAIVQTASEYNAIKPDYSNVYNKTLEDNGYAEQSKKAALIAQEIQNLQIQQQRIPIEMRKQMGGGLASAAYLQGKVFQSNEYYDNAITQQTVQLNTANSIMQRTMDMAKYAVDVQMKEDQVNQSMIASKLGALQNVAGIEQDIYGTERQVAMQQMGFKQQENMARLQNTLSNPTLASGDPQSRQVALKEAANGLFESYGALGITSGQEIVNNVNAGIASGKYANEQEGIQAEMQRVQSLPGFEQLKAAQLAKGTDYNVINPNLYKPVENPVVPRKTVDDVILAAPGKTFNQAMEELGAYSGDGGEMIKNIVGSDVPLSQMSDTEKEKLQIAIDGWYDKNQKPEATEASTQTYNDTEIKAIQDYQAGAKTMEKRRDLAITLKVPSPQVDKIVSEYFQAPKLTKQQANMAEAILTGQQPYKENDDPSGVILSAIQAVNPKMSSKAAWDTYYDYVSSTGKTNIQMTKLDTAMKHLQEYEHAVKAADNGDMRFANSLAQSIGQQFGGDDKVVLSQIALALANELSGAYGTENETSVSNWRNNAPTDVSPEAAAEWVKTAKSLLGTKLESSGTTFREAT